jgi:hypothetical protein
MKFYIAGKITGDPAYIQKFKRAEEALSRVGHSVMNPARLGDYPEFNHDDYMFITKAMQLRCDAVLFLPDWTESVGAMKEYEQAKISQQDIYFDISDVPPA